MAHPQIACTQDPRVGADRGGRGDRRHHPLRAGAARRRRVRRAPGGRQAGREGRGARQHRVGEGVSEVFAPVGGEVIAVNGELEAHPELVNQDPYGERLAGAPQGGRGRRERRSWTPRPTRSSSPRRGALMHRYLAGEDDRRRMLAAVGVRRVEELFASIPAEVRCDELAAAAGAQRGGGAAGVLGARRQRTSPRTASPASSAPASTATSPRRWPTRCCSAASSSPPTRPTSPRSPRARCRRSSSSRPSSASSPGWTSPTPRCTTAPPRSSRRC